MATWADILQEGSFDGVAFDFVSARDEHSNDLDVQKFPNRPGQSIVGRARNGGQFEIMAIFIEDDYPRVMNDLIAVLDNGGVPKEFVHPVFGSIEAACARFTVSHDAEDAIDSGTISITFQEHTDGLLGLTVDVAAVPARANAVRSSVGDCSAALVAFQGVSSVVSSVNAALSLTLALADTLEVAGELLSVLEVQSATNAVLALLAAPVVTLADYATTAQYELSAALLATSAATSALANGLILAKPPLTPYVVPADTNILSFTHALYGASDRADEVLALNSIADPSLIPAGLVVLAYAA